MPTCIQIRSTDTTALQDLHDGAVDIEAVQAILLKRRLMPPARRSQRSTYTSLSQLTKRTIYGILLSLFPTRPLLFLIPLML